MTGQAVIDNSLNWWFTLEWALAILALGAIMALAIICWITYRESK